MDSREATINKVSAVTPHRRETLVLAADPRHRQLDAEHEIDALRSDLAALAYAVSHDLRAPLRAVSGFSQLLVEDFGKELPEQALAYVSRISSNAALMSELIDGLLALYRVQPSTLARGTVDMASLATRAWERVCAQPVHQRLTVGSLPNADGDAELLSRVWESLLGNAVKFSAGLSDVIEVGAEAGSELMDGALASYWVRDHGVGFDEAHARDIFSMFRRAHAARDYPGHGVGLALVKRIVMAHGGDVWAEAAPSGGATFHFTLPAAA